MDNNQPNLLIEDEAFLRRITFAEEDRHLFTAMPWGGGYRWFRSPNVVPIERYQAAKKKLIPPRSKAS
jgi:hypothetical protein